VKAENGFSHPCQRRYVACTVRDDCVISVLFYYGIPLSLYISNTSTINMYNSYEQVVFRMTALISTYYGNIILRRVEIIAKSDS
jgi:hypothetical protein